MLLTGPRCERGRGLTHRRPHLLLHQELLREQLFLQLLLLQRLELLKLHLRPSARPPSGSREGLSKVPALSCTPRAC